MSGILKHNEEAPPAIAAPPWRMLHEGPAPAPPLDPEIQRLRDEIDALHRRAAEDLAAHERALIKARAEAVAEAKKGFERDEAAALQRLESALEKASSAFEASLADLERLAPALCHTALDNLFGEAGLDPTLVRAAIDKQINALRRESISFVAVSQKDFTDAAAFETLCAAHAGISIRLDANLAAGECRIGLELGHMELSVDAYRREVRDLLARWASA